MLIKKTYDVLKDYVIKHDLIARKIKKGRSQLQCQHLPWSIFFANCDDVTLDVSRNAQDKNTDNDTPTQDKQNELARGEEV